MTLAFVVSPPKYPYRFIHLFLRNYTFANMESDLANNVGESPRKRQRLSPSIESNTTSTPQHLSRNIPMIDPNKLVADSTGFQLEREAQVGILHFVSSTNSGFSGILKQRYVNSTHYVPWKHDIYHRSIKYQFTSFFQVHVFFSWASWILWDVLSIFFCHVDIIICGWSLAFDMLSHTDIVPSLSARCTIFFFFM